MRDFSTNGVVTYDVIDRIAWVKFNRPDKRNCMSPTLNRDIINAGSEGRTIFDESGKFAGNLDAAPVSIRHVSLPICDAARMPCPRAGFQSGGTD